MILGTSSASPIPLIKKEGWALFSILLMTVFMLHVQSFHHNIAPSFLFSLNACGKNRRHESRKIYISMKMDEVRIDSTRDSTWRTDSNPIGYSDNLEAYSGFSNLNQLGINVSDITRRKVIPMHNICGDDIFCNREINMNEIDAVGFDMDFTLAGYTPCACLLIKTIVIMINLSTLQVQSRL